MKRSVFWTTGVFVYIAFFSWYTNFDGPLTEEEITAILAKSGAAGRSQSSLENLERFMRSDTGNDFVMINSLDMNDNPRQLPATGPGADAGALMNHYMEHMYIAQLKRASHPVFFGQAVADAMDISGVQGAEHWEQGALFRYRSRRDVLAIAMDPAFNERHDYKMAALTKTIAFPVEPVLNPGDFRVLFALLLFSVFALIDMLTYGRRR